MYRYLHAMTSSIKLQLSRIGQALDQITDFRIMYLLCTESILRLPAGGILKVAYANTIVSRWRVRHLAQAQMSVYFEP